MSFLQIKAAAAFTTNDQLRTRSQFGGELCRFFEIGTALLAGACLG
jgi:hypothetical protein